MDRPVLQSLVGQHVDRRFSSRSQHAHQGPSSGRTRACTCLLKAGGLPALSAASPGSGESLEPVRVMQDLAQALLRTTDASV